MEQELYLSTRHLSAFLGLAYKELCNGQPSIPPSYKDCLPCVTSDTSSQTGVYVHDIFSQSLKARGGHQGSYSVHMKWYPVTLLTCGKNTYVCHASQDMTRGRTKLSVVCEQ